MNTKILSFFVGIAILFVIVYFSGVRDVFQILLRSNIYFIILALTLSMTSFILQSARWRILLKSINFNIPFSHAFYSYMSSMFLGNIAPFKALEPLRGYLLKIKFNYSFSKTVPLVLTEKVLDVFVFILFSLITILAIRDAIPSYITLFSFIGIFVFFLLSIAVLVILNSKKLTLRFFRIISILPVIKKFKNRIESIGKNFSVGFEELKKSKFLVPVFLLTLLIWFIEGGIFLFSAKAVGMDIPIVFFALPLLSILLGVLTFIPGGVGSVEAILILLLTSLNFPVPQATSAVLIYRLFTYLVENSIGAFTLSHVYGFDALKKFGLKL